MNPTVDFMNAIILRSVRIHSGCLLVLNLRNLFLLLDFTLICCSFHFLLPINMISHFHPRMQIFSLFILIFHKENFYKFHSLNLFGLFMNFLKRSGLRILETIVISNHIQNHPICFHSFPFFTEHFWHYRLVEYPLYFLLCW